MRYLLAAILVGISRTKSARSRISIMLTKEFIFWALLTALFIFHPSTLSAQNTLSAAEARAIGVQAYLYFYPLISMDITRKQLTNVEHSGGISAPPNTFVNVAEYPSATMKAVVRPNFDTLYSSAWLDLVKEPMIISAPDTGGRYYMLPMLDMWTDVFASPGARTTGTQARSWAIVRPGWTGVLPNGVERIDAPTPYVWVIGRTQTDGPADYEAVHKIQQGYKITPLSRWGKPAKPIVSKIDKDVDMKTPPKTQVDSMPAGKFFAYAAEIMKTQPPHLTDQPIIALMRRLGIERGKSFDLEHAAPAVKEALAAVPEDAQKLMASQLKTIATSRELLVDEHQYDGRLRQLLFKAGRHRAEWSWRQFAGRCDLSDQPWRCGGPAARGCSSLQLAFR